MYDAAVTENRRRAERLSSSARILWKRQGDDFLQLDRVRDVSAQGAFVVSDAVSEPDAALEFELHDEAGRALASGVAKVVRLGDGGMGIAFLDVTIDAAEVSQSMPPPRPPPPLPAAAPPLPTAPAATSDEWVAPQLEPLSVPPLDGVIIGIDLGTTNTCAAWVDERGGEGRPQIIPGRTGGNTIPTMINFDTDGRIHVGQRAADRQILYPRRTVYGSKRLIGRTWQPELAAEAQGHFAYPLGEAEGQRFGIDLGDQVVSMDAAAARVLREVRATAEDFLQREVRSAVITVPAYFSEVQREAVRRAAFMAELTVHRIVNEPTAAAVAYGHARGEEARVAVWDFGGGTFDFSVVDIRDERYEVVATGGDNFVGGADFDDELASMILERFLEAEGLEELEPTPQQIARLREAAELTKRALSVQSEFDVRLTDFAREPKRDLSVTITREDFEARTAPLVERTLTIARGVLLSASILPEEIDDVVLVGGTTRIPAVQRAVAELFGRRPSKRINPDEAVAHGAALLGHEISAGEGPVLLDLLPMTVGHAIDARRFVPVVKRNERLPCVEVLTFGGDLLGRIQVPLFQGESPDAAQNEYLCTVVVEDARLRDGERAQIRLSFDEHCLMAIDAFVERSGKPLEVTLDRERPLEDILQDLGAFDGPPAPEAWQLPETRISKVLGKLFGFFRKK